MSRSSDCRATGRGIPGQEVLKTQPIIGREDGPFAVDVLTLPDSNPWLCQMRPSGFDFLPDGKSAAVCTWDGDVWLIEGLDQPARGLTWRRIADAWDRAATVARDRGYLA